MGNRIVVCHWNNGGGWDAIEVSTSALGGHSNHNRDIWPPVEGVSEGQNWPDGEDIWLNDCAIETTATESPSPSASGTLPDTGPGEMAAMTLVGVMLIAAGAWLKVRSLRP